MVRLAKSVTRGASVCSNLGMPYGRIQWTVYSVVAVLTAVALLWVVSLTRGDATARDDAPPDATATQDPVGEQSPVEPTPTETVPVPDPEQSLAVGETFEGEQLSTTLLQTRTIKPPAELEANPEEAWFGIRVRSCLQADAPPSERLRRSAWLASDEAGGNYVGAKSPWEDFPAEQFPTSPLEPGACSLGWVLIPVPAGTAQRIQSVTFQPDSAVWVL